MSGVCRRIISFDFLPFGITPAVCMAIVLAMLMIEIHLLDQKEKRENRGEIFDEMGATHDHWVLQETEKGGVKGYLKLWW